MPFGIIQCRGSAPRRRGPRKAVEKFITKFPKNIIFPKGFLFNHRNFVGSHLKSQVPPKNVKTRSGSYSGLGLSIYVIKWN